MKIWVYLFASVNIPICTCYGGDVQNVSLGLFQMRDCLPRHDERSEKIELHSLAEIFCRLPPDRAISEDPSSIADQDIKPYLVEHLFETGWPRW